MPEQTINNYYEESIAITIKETRRWHDRLFVEINLIYVIIQKSTLLLYIKYVIIIRIV